MAGWREIRCQDARCPVPGGKVLAKVSPDGWVAIKRRHGGCIASGDLALLVCECGWIWRKPLVSRPIPDLDGAFASVTRCQNLEATKR